MKMHNSTKITINASYTDFVDTISETNPTFTFLPLTAEPNNMHERLLLTTTFFSFKSKPKRCNLSETENKTNN